MNEFKWLASSFVYRSSTGWSLLYFRNFVIETFTELISDFRSRYDSNADHKKTHVVSSQVIYLLTMYKCHGEFFLIKSSGVVLSYS